ncbi:amino acid ABC transporter permease [Roseovarius sp. 2305UL8-3]|uniref:amino acid ABC transporter permease n=1 Tax=Roseovarius conchicola TaxID=3121636 RepID=UPI0035292E0B
MAVQAATIIGLSLFTWFLIITTKSNLDATGMSSGFGFLEEKSGFEVAFSLIDYSGDNTYWRVFLVGITNTLLASVISIIGCTVIGFLVGIALLSRNSLTAGVARIYVETFRNVPLLLNILFWYFVILNLFPRVADSFEFGNFAYLNQRGFYLPAIETTGLGRLILLAIISLTTVAVFTYSKRQKELKGFGIFRTGWIFLISVVLIALFMVVGIIPTEIELPTKTRFNISGGVSIIPELFALVIGLSIYHGAFVAEYVRGGLLAVSKGQSEAALSTGLSDWHTMRLVILPQAMRVIIPPYISNNLNVVKNSSLGAAIAFPELVNVFAGTSLNQTGRAIEIVLMVMLFYCIISMLISLVMNIYNAKVQINER